MRSAKWHVSWCVAPKAQHSISSLGQRPRIREIPNVSAESAIHLRPSPKLHESRFPRFSRVIKFLGRCPRLK